MQISCSMLLFYVATSASDELDSDTEEDLKYQLRINRNRINQKYASFVSSLCSAVVETQVSLKDFRLYVLGLSAFQDQDEEKPNLLDDAKKAKIEQADSIHRIFEVLTTECCSFLYIDIFQSIIKRYGINTDSEDLKYSEHLIAYINQHKISEFLGINPRLETLSGSSNGNSKKLTLKFDVKLSSKFTKVYSLKTALAAILELSPSAIRLVGIEKGCVVVTFVIPDAVADILNSLSGKQIIDIQALSVKWLKCGDQTIYDTKSLKGNNLM